MRLLTASQARLSGRPGKDVLPTWVPFSRESEGKTVHGKGPDILRHIRSPRYNSVRDAVFARTHSDLADHGRGPMNLCTRSPHAFIYSITPRVKGWVN